MTRPAFSVAALVSILAACDPSEAPDAAGDASHQRLVASKDVRSSYVEVDAFIEIDDADGTGPAAGEANLCSSESLGCESTTKDTKFPGPDPLSPDEPGSAGEKYEDWSDLGPGAPHFFADDVADDVFAVRSCVAEGQSPAKADVRSVGVASNGTWLYLLANRASDAGQEQHHFVFTRVPPTFEATADCADGTWLWDLGPGDVMVTMTYDGRGGAEARAVRWSGRVARDRVADEVVRSGLWADLDPALFPAGTRAVYTSATVASIDPATGGPLHRGWMAEAAVDLEAVFGTASMGGWAMTVVTTASASARGRDDLKDFVGPIAFELAP